MPRFTGITGAQKSTSGLSSDRRFLEPKTKYLAKQCYEGLGVSGDRKKDMRDDILAHFLKSSDPESQFLEIRKLRKKPEVIEAYAIEFIECRLPRYTTCSDTHSNQTQLREMLVRLIDTWFSSRSTAQGRKPKTQTDDQTSSSREPRGQEQDVERTDRASRGELNSPEPDLAASDKKSRSILDTSPGFHFPDDAFELGFDPNATDIQRVEDIPYKESDGNYMFVSPATSPTSEKLRTPGPTRAEEPNVNHNQQRLEHSILDPNHPTSSPKGKRPIRPWENQESQSKQSSPPTLSKPKPSPVSTLSKKRNWGFEVPDEPQGPESSALSPTTKRMRVGNDLLSTENSREAPTSPIAIVEPQRVTTIEPNRNNDQTPGSPRRPARESTVVPVEPTDQQMSFNQACIEDGNRERQRYRHEAMQDLMNRYKKWQCENYVEDVKMQKTRLDRLLYEERNATLDRIVSDIQCIIRGEIWNAGQQMLAAARSQQPLLSPADGLAQ